MNRPQTQNMFALFRQMRAGQNNCARIGMAGAQVIKKILSQIVGCIDIEDEQVGPDTEDKLLRLFQTVSQLNQPFRDGLLQGRQDRRRQLLVGFQH